MSAPRPVRLRGRHVAMALFVGIALAGSCGGAGAGCSGCSCMESLPGGFPSNSEIVGAIQVRLSQSGKTFLENNGSGLVKAVLPTGLDFDVPAICDQSVLIGNIHVCATKQGNACVPTTPACKLSAQIGKLKLTPQASPGDTLRVVADVSAKTPANAPLRISGLLNCSVAIDTALAGAKEMQFLMDLKFVVDPVSKRTRIEIANPDIQNLDGGDLKITGGALCFIADLFKGLIVNQFKSQITGLVSGLVDEQLCAKCDTAPCPGAATCNSKKVCMLGSKCLQTLGMEGRLSLASLPGAPADAKMDVLAWLGGAVAMPQNGVTLALLGGVAPSKASTCVKPRPDLKPSVAAAPRSATLSGNRRPDGKPFDIGIGIHQSMLDHAAWSLYTSGGLCLQVDSSLSPLLAADAFSLIMPSLSVLTGGAKAPVQLRIRPGEPPKMSLGKGVVVDKGNGNYQITDPLINLELPKFGIDFFVLVEDRYVRVLTLTSDVKLPVALVFDSKGMIQPVLGALDKAFTNLKVTNSELLSEPPSELEKKFPVVLQLALGFLPDMLGDGFQLPDLMGIKLKDPTFTSVDNQKTLAIFAGLELGATTTSATVPATPAPRAADFKATLLGVEMPKDPRVLRLSRADDLQRGPRVRVAVPMVDSAGADLEYSYRVDRTTWSAWVRGGTLDIGSPLLFLRGKHTLELRARVRGQSAGGGLPQLLTFTVDPPRAPGAPRDGDATAGGCSAGGGAATSSLSWLLLLLGGALAFGRRRRRQGRGLVTTALLALVALLALGCDSSTGSGGDGGADGSGGCGANQYLCKQSGNCEPVQKTCKVDPNCAPDQTIEYGGTNFMDADTCQPIAQDCKCTGGANALSPGIIGRYSALAVGGGTLFASGYEQNFGDLVLVTASTSSPDQVTREVVDGVPSNANPTHDPAGYRGGVSTKGDNVGLYTDIIVNANGQPVISYHDKTNRSLKLAQRAADKSWKIHTVQLPTGAKEIVGRHTSLLEVGGNPAIVYTVLAVDDSKGGFTSELRYAVASNPTPGAETDWTVSVVDKAPMPCGGLCDKGQACFAGTGGTSSCKATGSGCPTCADGEACLAGKCTAVITAGLADVPTARGLWPKAVVAGGSPLVVYYDGVAGTLRAARLEGAAFKTAIVKRHTSDDVGSFPTALVDGSTVHVTYQNRSQQTLAYLQLDPSTLKASSDAVIDDGLRSGSPTPVGADSALALDGSGALHVVYQDQLNSNLLHAKRTSGGAWEPRTPTDANLGRLLKGGPKGYGFYSDLVSEGGQIYGSTFFFDAQGKPRGNLELFAVK